MPSQHDDSTEVACEPIPTAPVMTYAQAVVDHSEEGAPPPYEAIPVVPASERFNDLAARFQALQTKN